MGVARKVLFPLPKWAVNRLRDMFSPTCLCSCHGGAPIQKIEIRVVGNEDPSRIARLTLDAIQKIGRKPDPPDDVA